MKLTCTQENLIAGLTTVSRVSDKQATLPILSNILFRTKNNGLELSATNLELAIQTTIRAKIEVEGEFTVNARLITDFVGTLEKENIIIELTDAKELLIQGENHQTLIHGLEASEFPVIPEVAQGTSIQIKSGDLRKSFFQTLFSMAGDATRPELQGALVGVNQKTITVVATDSFRLSETQLNAVDVEGQHNSIIVPSRTLQETARILDYNNAENVMVRTSETQVEIQISETKVISRIISGKYPDYKNIIPTQFKSELVFSVKEMERAIKTTSLFCKQGINDIRLSVDERFTDITVQAENTTAGKNTSRVPTESKKQNLDIVFNYKFLLEGLQHLGSEKAILKTNDAQSAALLTAPSNPHYIYLIMPIRQ